VPLILSAEAGAAAEALEFAHACLWPHGVKTVIQHPEPLGLKKHLVWCSSQALEYGSVVVLEDDLLVSPFAYATAVQALQAYAHEPAVAGISLYSYRVAENGFLGFDPTPYAEGGWFMQVPSSWGQAYTAAQWQGFLEWWNQHPEPTDTELLPQYVLDWSAQSWKKHFLRYLVATGRFCWYPPVSYSTNPGHAGTHADTGALYLTTLATEPANRFRAYQSEDCPSFDAWFEPLPGHPGLASAVQKLKNSQPALFTNPGLPPAVDFYRTKPLELLLNRWVLTSFSSLSTESTGLSVDLACVPVAGKVLSPDWHNVVQGVEGSACAWFHVEHSVEHVWTTLRSGQNTLDTHPIARALFRRRLAFMPQLHYARSSAGLAGALALVEPAAFDWLLWLPPHLACAPLFAAEFQRLVARLSHLDWLLFSPDPRPLDRWSARRYALQPLPLDDFYAIALRSDLVTMFLKEHEAASASPEEAVFQTLFRLASPHTVLVEGLVVRSDLREVAAAVPMDCTRATYLQSLCWYLLREPYRRQWPILRSFWREWLYLPPAVYRDNATQVYWLGTA
jgi:hypothetical protein